MATHEDLIKQWQDSKVLLERVKAEEQRLRLLISRELFGIEDDDLVEGTRNVPLAGGYKLKRVGSINRSFVSREVLDETLDAIEKEPHGELIASRIVKWDPKLSMTEYKQAPEKIKNMLDKIIVQKPGMPTITLEAPKVAK